MTTHSLLILLNLTQKKQSIKKKNSPKVWTVYLLSQKSISVLNEACFALNYFSSACRLRDGWRLLYKTMERRCLKHMMMSMGMGGLRLFPSKRRYLPQQQRGSEAPLTETFHLLFRSVTQAYGRYLSLGTRVSSRSSSSKVTGQILLPLMPGSTSSQRLRNKHEGPAHSWLILHHSHWEEKG